MELEKFINLLATIFGTFGAVYVLLGILNMSPEIMAKQAQTYWDFNTPQIENLAKQKADSITGFTFIIIAFILTIINIIFTPNNVQVFQSKIIPIVLSAIFAGIVYITLHFISNGIYKDQKLKIGKVIISQHVEEIIEKGCINKSEANSLPILANKLLDISVPKNQATEEMLNQLGKILNKEIPKNFDFSKCNK